VNGRLSEIVGPAKFVVASVGLSVAANVFMAFQDSLIVMAVIWGLNGYFQSMAWTPGVAILTRWWPGATRGFATGFANAFSGFGQVAAILSVALGFAVFGLPVTSVCLLSQGEKAGARSVLPALFATVASIITAGVLSPGIAAATPNAFYETCRSLNLFGVARRFEPLISAGMTVGWFVLISLLLSCCGALTHKLFPGRGRYGVWIAAVFAAIVKLCGLHIWPWLPVFLGGLFWVGFPLLAQGLEREKKS
jgi:MFS family permease